MSQRPLAKCAKDGSVLARVQEREGVAGIEYAAAVGVLRESSAKHHDLEGRRGEFIAFSPRNLDGATNVSGYCTACDKDFDLPLDELSRVFRENGSPLILESVKKPFAI